MQDARGRQHTPLARLASDKALVAWPLEQVLERAKQLLKTDNPAPTQYRARQATYAPNRSYTYTPKPFPKSRQAATLVCLANSLA